LTDFRIFETVQFQDDLKTRLGPSSGKIIAKIHGFVYPQLRKQPYFSKNIRKLKGYKPDTWRYRVGGYRLFYEIDDRQKIVFMIALAARSKGYRRK
jgi:mRNA interferase RelE/StbE